MWSWWGNNDPPCLSLSTFTTNTLKVQLFSLTSFNVRSFTSKRDISRHLPAAWYFAFSNAKNCADRGSPIQIQAVPIATQSSSELPSCPLTSLIPAFLQFSLYMDNSCFLKTLHCSSLNTEIRSSNRNVLTTNCFTEDAYWEAVWNESSMALQCFLGSTQLRL